LIGLMGPVDHSLHLRSDVSVLMLCGLQGSGKTTTCGKLGKSSPPPGRKPMLVAADFSSRRYSAVAGIGRTAWPGRSTPTSRRKTRRPLLAAVEEGEGFRRRRRDSRHPPAVCTSRDL